MVKKRVTKQTLRRRRAGALLILLLIIVGIILLANSCSDKKESSGKKSSSDKKIAQTTVPLNTQPLQQNNSITITTALGNISDIQTTEPMNETTTADDGNKVESITLTFYATNLKVGEKKMPIVTMSPSSATDKSELWESSNTTIATVDQRGDILGVSPGTCYITVKSKSNPEVYAEVKVTVIADEEEPELALTSSSESGATYIKGILIVNKTYSLPEDYNPGLDPTTKSQFDLLSADAKKEGLDIHLSSGFRSYDYQKRIYNNYVNAYGQATADTFSARPGHSEHQTGLAIDVNSIDDSFASTPESAWLESNAHKYGFIIRYPKGKEDITGYKYESWHIRYLGVDTATAVYNSGLTLEEYLGVNSKYNG